MLWLAAWNGIVLLTYAADKAQAKLGWRRTPEATLLWMAALAGAPGALLAMALVRHKTQKPAFRYGVPVLLLLQGGLWWAAQRLIG